MPDALPPTHDDPRPTTDAVPPGAWAVGVSGGADSVALLALLHDRPDLQLTVVHLDHETRGVASAADAAFVADLASRWHVPCVVARRSALEPRLPDLPANRSARFRALRWALFRDVVTGRGLRGVVLAHHADDQAETVLHRLLRGSGPTGLTGMTETTTIRGLLVVRPLLNARREDLRTVLRRRGQAWREDASNASDAQARNRARKVLAAHPHLVEPLLALADASRAWRDWLRSAAPALADRFPVAALRDAPAPVALEAARAWLARHGTDPDDTTAAATRLVRMATDAASPPRAHFSGGLLVRRRRGEIFLDEE